LNNSIFSGDFHPNLQFLAIISAFVSKDATSLLVCTSKNFFVWGLWIFCEWRHKWRTFRPP